MTEKNTEPPKNKIPKKTASSYTMDDVFKITDDLFQLSKEKNITLVVCPWVDVYS